MKPWVVTYDDENIFFDTQDEASSYFDQNIARDHCNCKDQWVDLYSECVWKSEDLGLCSQ